jgi:hypothetical protein
MRLAFSSLGAADWLSLAAAPTFALMAGITAFAGDGGAMLCTQAGRAFGSNEMLPMYLLMAAFHLAPWFRLTSRPGAGA